jgi:hypothetical protein
MAVYFAKMKEYVDEMAAAGKKLDNDDVVSYILIGFDADYNGVVENVNARVNPISISDLFAKLLAAEARVEGQHQVVMSANAAARGGGSFRGRGGGRDGGHGGRGGFGRGYGCCRGTGERPTCQICEKIGHSAGRCCKRFDREFELEEKSANNASNTIDASYGVVQIGIPTQGQQITSCMSLTSLQPRRSILGRRRSRWPVEQVWELITLGILFCILLLVIFV